MTAFFPSALDSASRWRALRAARCLPEPRDVKFDAAQEGSGWLVALPAAGSHPLHWRAMMGSATLRGVGPIRRGCRARRPLRYRVAPRATLSLRDRVSFWEGVDVPGRARVRSRREVDLPLDAPTTR